MWCIFQDLHDLSDSRISKINAWNFMKLHILFLFFFCFFNINMYEMKEILRLAHPSSFAINLLKQKFYTILHNNFFPPFYLCVYKILKRSNLLSGKSIGHQFSKNKELREKAWCFSINSFSYWSVLNFHWWEFMLLSWIFYILY